MNPESINSVIDHLADKLAIPTIKLMELLTRLGYKNVGSVIMEIIVGCILLFIIIQSLKHLHKIDDSKKSDPELFVMILLVVSVVFFIFLIIALLIDSTSLIFWICDPEAWALDYIIKLLHLGI